MVEKKIYRGQEVNTTQASKQIDKNELIYRGVDSNTHSFDLARIRASHINRRNPLYYRGVVYKYTT